MDSDEDNPVEIPAGFQQQAPPDFWDTSEARQARAYHYGAAQAASQPYTGDADAWRDWRATHDTFTGMQADHDFTARESAQRTIEHDKPPVWDGQKPESLARPYIKHLDLWLETTRQPRKNVGLILLTYSRGDIRALIDEWEMEELKDEGFG